MGESQGIKDGHVIQFAFFFFCFQENNLPSDFSICFELQDKSPVYFGLPHSVNLVILGEINKHWLHHTGQEKPGLNYSLVSCFLPLLGILERGIKEKSIWLCEEERML